MWCRPTTSEKLRRTVELLKIMMPTARVKFIRDGKMMNKTAGFSCVWVCRGFGSNIHMEYLGHRGKKDP